jgi:hypothetical protein
MKGDGPLVSIIMPAFNAEKYIEEAIQSVCSQSYTNWELLVINDGSTDSTRSIVKHFSEQDHRIRLIDNEVNKGLIEVRNLGLKLANGKYIAHLDSDDVALPERLAVQVSFMQSHPDYVGIGTACIEVDSAGRQLRKVEREIADEDIPVLLIFSNYFINSTIMLEAKVAREVSYDPAIPLAEDYCFFVKLSERGKLGNLNKPLVKYRIHESNTSSIKAAALAKMLKEIQRRQLCLLQIEPTAEEMDLHAQLVDGLKAPTEAALIEIEKWLLKLIAANRSVKRYKAATFEHYCAFFFRRCCQRSTLGLKAIKIYRRSSLSGTLKSDLKGNSIFFVKSILKAN